jgi:hypothetical protein
MAVNDFVSYQRGLDSPAESAEAITPSDGSDLGYVTRGIYVGGGGNVAAVMLRGETVTFTGLSAGSILPIRAARVLSTGTTATLLVGLR